MDDDKKLTMKVQQLGFNTKTASESIRSFNIEFRELIAEDWRDFVEAFYFPTQSQVLTNPAIIDFISRINSELLKSRSNPEVINTLVRQAYYFFEQNFEIVEDLISHLKDEQMNEAVLQIAKQQLAVGQTKSNHRMQAYNLLIIGELQNDSRQIDYLLQAIEIHKVQ